MVGYFATNLRGLHGCKRWSILNATRKMESVGEPRDLAFWGVLGFSMMEVFPPHPDNEQSLKCSISFDSCFLINLLYV